MKKLINEADDVVREALAGMQAAHPDLIDVHIDPHYIVRKGAPTKGKVALGLGRRLGTRAHARRLRREGHARCGLPG